MLGSSFLIVALGQPARMGSLGPLAAAFGFALFWRAMLQLPSQKGRCTLAFLWFTAVQLVQLSWMGAIHYTGPLILLIYFAMSLGLGGQFALLSWFVRARMGFSHQFALAGLWVFCEWTRLFVCSGFTWNPAGLFLSYSPYSLQLVSLLGIYGLSFWVIWTNLAGLQAMLSWQRRSSLIYGFLALGPYLFGAWHLSRYDAQENPQAKALLVQTGLLPERKEYDPNLPEAFIPLAQQWKRILDSIKGAAPVDRTAIDLIVLPEGALPYGAYRPLYDLQTMEAVWEECFGLEAIEQLPPLEAPQAVWEKGRWRVSNAYWAQALAILYRADVIVGLDDGRYNAAFLFRSELSSPQRYEKRILVPIAEYIPFSQLQIFTDFIAQRFGITSSFAAGSKATLFSGKIPLSVSICYEETYGDLVRQGRVEGAELFVNLTNDAWYPSSLLTEQHFTHGILRAAENGVPLLRACNTGITGGVDRFGRVICTLAPSEQAIDSLLVSLPLATHKTWYTLWGDAPILWISGLGVFLGLWYTRKKRLL